MAQQAEPCPSLGASSADQKYCVCIVSDFFVPRLGGVELHQYLLAQSLLYRGHRVIVVTGTYGASSSRQGVRYLPNGLKVYYCPTMNFHSQVSLPTVLSFFPLLRDIYIRERVDIVHGHQTTSPMTHEAILLAGALGLRAVFTDHSLFGFGNVAAVHLNKNLRFSLANVDHSICVSHTLRENLVLRAHLNPADVSTIPNALDHERFKPDPACAPDPSEQVVIVVLSRLVYRKGVDIVLDVIPEVCRRFPNVKFIIGGDGPKKSRLDDLCDRHGLTDRVEIIGEVAQTNVRDVMVRGHIFLNCSLTESFCIAVLEAISCGLHVVATRVGGVPEIVPEKFITYAQPNADDVLDKIASALANVARPGAWLREVTPRHAFVAEHYSWHDVGRRTETVYREIMARPRRTLASRIVKYLDMGGLSGLVFAGVVTLAHVAVTLLELVCPRRDVEFARDGARGNARETALEEWSEWGNCVGLPPDIFLPTSR